MCYVNNVFCALKKIKESAFNARICLQMPLIPGLGRSSGERNGNPVQYSCLENSMDQGTWWAIYSPWGCKESDTTERLTLSHSPEVQIDHLDVNHGLDKYLSIHRKFQSIFHFRTQKFSWALFFRRAEGRINEKWLLWIERASLSSASLS